MSVCRRYWPLAANELVVVDSADVIGDVVGDITEILKRIRYIARLYGRLLLPFMLRMP